MTGDKLETAMNIGFSCNLLKRDMTLIVIKEAKSEQHIFEQVNQALESFWEEDGKPKTSGKYSVIIDGESLAFALLPSCKEYFLELGCRCATVLCCRVSPLQKAKVVALVKNGLVLLYLLF